MADILAIYGSPRRKGNTSTLLRESVRGAREQGASVEEVILRDLKITPCLEIYACKKTGRCVIRDDFDKIHDLLLSCRGLMLASPIFFYAVSAHTKIFMDRCQALWARKYCLEEAELPGPRKGLFISAGATQGRRLFEGAVLGVRYLFHALDMELWRTLLYRGLEREGEAGEHPEYLEEAYRAGKELFSALSSP